MTAIQTKDGFSLEARWDDAAVPASSIAVLCHPHPLEDGTMEAPLLRTVTTSLNAAGIHVLRFNFRGVGSSEGTWDQGIGEVHDVAAAVEAAQLAFPTMPLGIAGWSFGATTSLAWQLETGSALWESHPVSSHIAAPPSPTSSGWHRRTGSSSSAIRTSSPRSSQ